MIYRFPRLLLLLSLSHKNMKLTIAHQTSSFLLPQAPISIKPADEGLVPRLLTVALSLPVDSNRMKLIHMCQISPFE